MCSVKVYRYGGWRCYRYTVEGGGVIDIQWRVEVLAGGNAVDLVCFPVRFLAVGVTVEYKLTPFAAK